MNWIFILFMGFLLSGCTSDPDKEVQNVVKNSRAKKTERPSLIPQFKEREPCDYQSSHLRDPFEIYENRVSTNLSNGSQVALDRPKEPLEFYPLESLKMVGYLEKNEIFWGLIKDKQGNIYKVSVGQHLGQNGGEIKKIHEQGIDIEENGFEAGNEKKQFTLPLSEFEIL